MVSIRSLAEVESLQLAVDELTPEDTVMARNELQVLAEMISRLPEKTRKIFLLSRVSGLSQKEVSRRTGIAESTVEKHIAKGLGLLMAAGPLMAILGQKIEAVITRLLGVLLAALAVQFVIDGISERF